MKISIICGGPSLERGISLNSARSVLDHLQRTGIEIVPFYLDHSKNAYAISTAQLYSNTPSDFDFKLRLTAKPLNKAGFVKALKETDLCFPAMHGFFGEDGGIQHFLEQNRIPFVGSGSVACKKAFDKFAANEYIRSQGFFTLPSALLKIYHSDHKKILSDFFRKHRVTRAVVKPASGGSSIGVFSVSTVEEALEKAQLLFSKRMDTRLVVEPFATGTEFTVIVLENRFGMPVALTPTEIETDYTEHQIFDFRKKYLPTRQVIWHCPPRFDNRTIDIIQTQAEQLFKLLGMRDFGRFDGWVLPDGKVWFCDFNMISGMEQNSFLFQQASRIGMTHQNVLNHIVENACRRYGIVFPQSVKNKHGRRKEVYVLFGGGNSERQVSLMSGSNVWLKLRNSAKYKPIPHLLDRHGTVWKLPYQLILNHTVEEITENCLGYESAKQRLDDFENRARLRLGLWEGKDEQEFFAPQKMDMETFLSHAPFVFLALHGGKGENGEMQAILERKKIGFNGSGSATSRLCMDKWETSRHIETLGIPGVSAIAGELLKTAAFIDLSVGEVANLWHRLKRDLATKTLIIKPRADGCSTGVVRIQTAADLLAYQRLLQIKAPFAPRHTFRNQSEMIEMPTVRPEELVCERFIETDGLRVRGHTLKETNRSGWIEVTVGVLEEKGIIRALHPSITVAEGEVLSVEEKFQGGTGVNITPPPNTIVAPKALAKAMHNVGLIAKKMGIGGYARIDAFLERITGDLLVIEINTLPALTPSTVLYHQGLAEKKTLFPGDFIEQLIENKGY